MRGVRVGGFCIGLDHTDDAMGLEDVVHHSHIAWFENGQRQLPTRQQQDACKREDRNDGRQFVGSPIGIVDAHAIVFHSHCAGRRISFMPTSFMQREAMRACAALPGLPGP